MTHRNDKQGRRSPPGGNIVRDAGEIAWALPDAENGFEEAVAAETIPADLAALLGDEPETAAFTTGRLAPARLLRGMYARRRLLVMVAAAITLASLLTVYATVQSHWEAVTTLILTQGAEELSVGGGKPYQVPEYRIETLLDALKLPSSLSSAASAAGVATSPTTLARAVDVSVARNSNILNIKLRWSDPDKAAALTNALAEAFVDRTRGIRVDEAEQDMQRYLVQLEDAQLRVRRVDADVLEFQQRHEISDFDEETKARLIDLSRLEAEHRTTLAEVEGLLIAREELRAGIDVEPETIISATLYRNPLRQRLEEYVWQLKEARSRYTEDNPKVIKLTQKVGALKLVIDETGDQSAPEETLGPNELRKNMQLRLHELNDEIRQAEGRAEGLQQSVKQTREKLAYLSATEKEYAALKSKQYAARQLESSLTAKAEEARVAASSGEGAFQILERAATPTAPAPSSKKIMVIAGAIVGCGLAFFLVLFLEVTDPLVRDHCDLRDIVEEHCIGSFSGKVRPLNSRGLDANAQKWRRLVNDIKLPASVATIAVVSATSDKARAVCAWNIAATLAIRDASTVLAIAMHDNGRDDQAPVPTNKLHATCFAGLRYIRTINHGSSRFDERSDTGWLDRLRGQAPLIVVDVPPLKDSETALELAALADVAIVVAEASVTRRSDLDASISRLRARGVEIAGAVVAGLEQGRVPEFSPVSDISDRAGNWWSTHRQKSSEVRHA